MKITFVMGGARSGKSAFALREAARAQGRKAYIATAEAVDEEMRDRIKRHKEERGSSWETFEEPVHLSRVLAGLAKGYHSILIDCLTMWLSNLLLGRQAHPADRNAPEERIEEFITGLERFRGTDTVHVILVSNEVGMGIVPDNWLSRRFRDLAGMLNQKVAGVADEVYLVTAGIPSRIK